VLPPGQAVTEQQMFGGLAFMRGAHVFCGIVKDALVVRLGPEEAGRALDRPHVQPMDFTGRAPAEDGLRRPRPACKVMRCGSGSMPPPAMPAAY
jgi:TfoX N-terminal domain